MVSPAPCGYILRMPHQALSNWLEQIDDAVTTHGRGAVPADALRELIAACPMLRPPSDPDIIGDAFRLCFKFIANGFHSDGQPHGRWTLDNDAALARLRRALGGHAIRYRVCERLLEWAENSGEALPDGFMIFSEAVYAGRIDRPARRKGGSSKYARSGLDIAGAIASLAEKTGAPVFPDRPGKRAGLCDLVEDVMRLTHASVERLCERAKTVSTNYDNSLL